MQAASAACRSNAAKQHSIDKEGTILYCLADARQILIDDTPGPDVHDVPPRSCPSVHPGGQPPFLKRQPVMDIPAQPVHVWGPGLVDGIIFLRELIPIRRES
jgi:hypothetical protein